MLAVLIAIKKFDNNGVNNKIDDGSIIMIADDASDPLRQFEEQIGCCIMITQIKVCQLKATYNRLLKSELPLHLKIALLEGFCVRLLYLVSSERNPLEEKSLSSSTFDINSNRSFCSAPTNILEDVICSMQTHSRSPIKQERETIIQECRRIQQNIMHRRNIKISLNQDIETMEEDMMEMQKIVLTKLQFMEQLDKKIAKAKYKIEKGKLLLNSRSPMKKIQQTFRNIFH